MSVKELTIVAAIIALVATGGTQVSGQDNSQYPLPEPLEYVDQGSLDSVLGSVYPVGWSPDGKFAFVRQWFIGGGCGCQGFDIVIQDLVTDEIVWEIRGEEYLDLEQVWSSRLDDAIGQFETFGIDISRPGRFVQGTILKHAGRTYRFEVDVLGGPQEFPYPYSEGSATYDVINGSIVTAVADGLGRKEIYSSGVTDESSIVDVDVVGSILSPFENRAAVIFAEVELDYEHSRTRSFRVIGSHLTVGFR